MGIELQSDGEGIQFYSPGDYDQTKAVLQESGMFYETEQKKFLDRKIERDPESIIIYKSGGVVIGVVFISDNGNEAMISRLCVSHKYRGKGISSVLMKKAEEVIKNRGISKITAFINSTNSQLRGIYEGWGYEIGNNPYNAAKKM